MKTSENTDKLYPALFNAIGKIQTLKKEETGYGYKYLSLEALIGHLKQILSDSGLLYTQMVGNTADGNISLTTRLIHAESSQWQEGEASIPLTDMKGVNKSQAAGAAITYLRRYSLTSLFGIAENDSDGMIKEEAKKPMVKNNRRKDPELEKAMGYYLIQDDMRKMSYIEGLLEEDNDAKFKAGRKKVMEAFSKVSFDEDVPQ